MNRISRKLRIALASVLALALILSVAALAAPGKGKKPGKGAKVSASQYAYGKNRITICHKGKTIKVAQPAVKAHLRHGDHVGPC